MMHTSSVLQEILQFEQEPPCPASEEVSSSLHNLLICYTICLNNVFSQCVFAICLHDVNILPILYFPKTQLRLEPVARALSIYFE